MATFFDVLRAGLWGESLSSLTTADALAALQEAERQSVVGVVFDAINGNGIRLYSRQVFEYYSMSLQIEHQNTLVNKELCALARLFSDNGIRYAVVKGQIAAQCYRKPKLRQSGDIDFYCDTENFERAKALIEQEWDAVYEVTENTSHLAFCHNTIDFEQHSRLIMLNNKRLEAYWGKVLANDDEHFVTINNQQVHTLSPTLHALYIFLHLYRHLLGLGIGIRQFCDLAMMLHSSKGDIDHEALRYHLKVLGMERAYRACGCILIKKLGLPPNEFTYITDKKDLHYAKKILDVVMYRGNMGKYNKKGGMYGAMHNLEATGIKFAHFFKFMPLAPAYSCRWIVNEMKRKISNKLFR